MSAYAEVAEVIVFWPHSKTLQKDPGRIPMKHFQEKMGGFR